MPQVTIIYGEKSTEINTQAGEIIGEVIARAELPLEQPCAGKGTCGLCKVLNEKGLAEPDDIERKHLTPGEIAVGNRLACRARITGDARIILAPVVIYSNKVFKGSNRYRRVKDVPLGLAIDLGSTTVAAFLTMLDNSEVCKGAASLNQQSVYGADVISRLSAAVKNKVDARRMHRLAVASINQAVDSLKLSKKIRNRIRRATVVCNPAMHHLLVNLPVGSLALMPFQPFRTGPILNAVNILDGTLTGDIQLDLPPLIGGFVGSDALACLEFFGFDQAKEPIAAIDLGTNGEVMVTDGEQILVASTAAGPAFEGVNISCGSRAVDGAVTKVRLNGNEITFETIADEEPVGLTGSGLLSAIKEFRQAGMIAANGRIEATAALLVQENNGSNLKALRLTPDGRLSLKQKDIRELQKAKGAIRAAIDVLMAKLELLPKDINRLILTGSFGGQVDIDAVLAIGMIPPVPRSNIETIANGAGFGAAMFLTDAGFEHGLKLAGKAKQIDLDLDKDFFNRFIHGMSLEA
jgi:uncharacterized 2Fe-2S/4Fe-4S cluster protein (DUF4445 family)